MNCFTCERNLSAYLDDELPMDERIELESHLDGCETCRGEFESHQAAWETAHEATADAAPDGLWSGIESQLQDEVRTGDGLQDLTLLLKGLAAEVQDLRRTVDGLRRDLPRDPQMGAPVDATIEAYGRDSADSIRVRDNPFRPGVPREASIDQLRSGS